MSSELDWVYMAASMNTSSDELVPSIAVDYSGAAYVAYATSGTISGETRTAGVGEWDLVVSKIDRNGASWAKQNTTVNAPLGTLFGTVVGIQNKYIKIVLDDANNSFVLFTKYDNDTEVPTLGLAKYDASGSLVWVVYDFNSGKLQITNDYGINLKTISSNLYIQYTYADGTINIIKLNSSDGSVVWLNNSITGTYASAKQNCSIAVDSSNVYVIHTVTGDGTTGSTDVAVSRINSEGNLVWTTMTSEFNTTGNNSILSSPPQIIISNAGVACLTIPSPGSYISEAPADESSVMIFFKIDSEGIVTQATQIGLHTLPDDFNSNIKYSMINAVNGNIYITYERFSALPGSTQNGTPDNVIVKLSSSGSVLWESQGSGWNTNAENTNASIAVDIESVYIAYAGSGTIASQTNSGGTDIVVAKLNRAPPRPTAIFTINQYLEVSTLVPTWFAVVPEGKTATDASGNSLFEIPMEPYMSNRLIIPNTLTVDFDLTNIISLIARFPFINYDVDVSVENNNDPTAPTVPTAIYDYTGVKIDVSDATPQWIIVVPQGKSAMNFETGNTVNNFVAEIYTNNGASSITFPTNISADFTLADIVTLIAYYTNINPYVQYEITVDKSNLPSFDENIYERSTDAIYGSEDAPIVIKPSLLIDSDIIFNNNVTYNGSFVTGVTFPGTYDAAVRYELGQIVLLNSTYYLCTVGPDPRGYAYSGTLGNSPTTFTSIWHAITMPSMSTPTAVYNTVEGILTVTANSNLVFETAVPAGKTAIDSSTGESVLQFILSREGNSLAIPKQNIINTNVVLGDIVTLNASYLSYNFTIAVTRYTPPGGGGGGGGGTPGSKQAGQSSIYGEGTPIKLIYDPLVSVDLANNEINLADAYAYGHRVKINIPKANLNECFTWNRTSGTLYPTGAVDASTLKGHLITAIANGLTDLDGKVNGLDFSSTSMTTALQNDPRLREADASGNQPITANDIVLAYVLYKLYGKSIYDTIDNIFNLEDAHGMLSNEMLFEAIRLSMVNTDGTTSVEKMFKDLLSSDPQRFFDASGKQITGLFEKNTDVSGNGNWNITAGDVIEVRIEFVFGAAVTRRDGADYQIVTVNTPDNTKNLGAGEKFFIRLQITGA
jgi:hypothetical protein